MVGSQGEPPEVPGTAHQRPAQSRRDLGAEEEQQPGRDRKVSSRKHLLPSRTTTLLTSGAPGCFPVLKEDPRSSSAAQLVGRQGVEESPFRNKRRSTAHEEAWGDRT